MEGPHDDRHRPPPLDDPARRPDPRLPARPDRRARHPRRAARPGRPLRPTLSRAVPGRSSTRGMRWHDDEAGAWSGTWPGCISRRPRAAASRSTSTAATSGRRRVRPRFCWRPWPRARRWTWISILAKKRQSFERYEIHVQGDQRDGYPQVFTRIDVIHELEGPSLDVGGPCADRSSCRPRSTARSSRCSAAGATEIHNAYRVVRTGALPLDRIRRGRRCRAVSPAGDPAAGAPIRSSAAAFAVRRSPRRQKRVTRPGTHQRRKYSRQPRQ